MAVNKVKTKTTQFDNSNPATANVRMVTSIGGDEGTSEFESFAAALISVPKNEIDAERAKEASSKPKC